MDAVPPFDAETIARHAEAVRRLARRLVWDQDRAQDVAQDALVAALEQRTPPHKGLGPWIKGVTRKLAANTQRRERRLKERHARLGTPAQAPAPDEVIERLHAQRLVGDALTALGEPYRRTLYMRYFEDLPPRAIAAQLGLPVNTVHTHLRRGRARLKEEIEARSGKRRPWHVALLPLLAQRVPTPTPVAASAAAGLGGTLLMLATSRYAIALLVVLLFGGGIAYLTLDDSGDDTSMITEAGEVSPPPEAPKLEGAGKKAPTEEAAAKAPAEPPPAAAASKTTPVLFEGCVLDPKGRALSGVPVHIHAALDSGSQFDPTVPIAKTESDAQGRFEIRLDTALVQRMPESKDRWLRVHVAASHPRWLFAVGSFSVDTTEAHTDTRTHRKIELRFKEPFSVRCRVLDEAGRPIADATCRWGDGSGYTPRPDGRYYEAVTDAEGRAKIEIPIVGEDPASVFLRTAGVRLVHAEARGYARATSRSIRIIQPTPGRAVEADIVLPAAHTITGRIVDDRGDTVPELALVVRLYREGASLYWSDRLGNDPRTDASGGFKLENVPAGRWTMNVRASGYAVCETHVVAPSRDITLQLRRKTTILVRYVRPDGTLLLPTLYHAVREGEPPFSRYGARRTDGPLRIDRLGPGRYQITVKLIGRVKPFVHALKLVTGSNDPTTFTVPEAEGRSVKGRLLDVTGKPVAGIVTLRTQGADRDDSQARIDHPVDERGTFGFEGLAPGSYILWAQAKRHAPKEWPLEVTDKNPKPVDLRLGRGATVRVRLPRVPKEATGVWQLQLRTADGGTIEVTAPEPDEDGWLEFGALPVGKTTIMLESTAFRADPVPTDTYVAVLDYGEGETVEYAFPRASGVTLKGRVFDAKGKPHAQLGINLRRVSPDFEPSSGMPYMNYGWKNLFTDDEGRFEGQGLLPGRYIVLNVRQGGVPIVFKVTEDAGQTIELRAR